MTEEEKMENKRIVTALARFYDRLVDERGHVDAKGGSLDNAKVAAVLAEAGLAEEGKVALLLADIKARVASGADSDLIYHRERMFRAEYAVSNGMESLRPEEAARAIDDRRYADHYLIGIQRARALHIDTQSTTEYPTAEQWTAIAESKLKQAATLGMDGFAQPLVARARVEQAAAEYQRLLAEVQRQQLAAEYQRMLAEVRRQEMAEVQRQQMAAAHQRQLAEVRRQQMAAAQQQMAEVQRQQLAAARQRQISSAYQQVPGAYRPNGVFPVMAPSAAAHPPRAAGPHATVPVLPQFYARPAAHAYAPAGAQAPRAAAQYDARYGVPHGAAPAFAPNQPYRPHGRRPGQ
ncbi:hypothetical protein KQY30_15370 [Streptomyces sp. GMY02]|uniref:hypothetical protein n=1 Tax=Streptomyces sp. GMY02 TaxID=1333528 RepID=UPI001C2CB8A1|nr:hypothetical protein [Streptomyces sp. GMY02]QXE35436.1 hypothetical protein KQY30_15370 [Streptomyces sp. GMY02]